jgi:2-C-methyl-D-erythritol 2,4-cyclodiphosphate synthase
MRCGIGFDAHAFAAGRKLILGGVQIDFDRGLEGHSDADVLTHAIIDALLGAAGMGDIGRLYPDTDRRYRNISSLLLLEDTAKKLSEAGWKIVNIDATIVAQRPRLSGYMGVIQGTLAGIMKIGLDRINIKATTTEKLGFTGREEGIGALATALIGK